MPRPSPRSRPSRSESAVGIFTFTPDYGRILVACGRSHEVHVIDAERYTTLEVLGGFKLPWGVVTFPKAFGSLDAPERIGRGRSRT
ncbi:MAG: hypothetical protein ACREX9_02255 [Gammaproteobacteria bacterium]